MRNPIDLFSSANNCVGPATTWGPSDVSAPYGYGVYSGVNDIAYAHRSEQLIVSISVLIDKLPKVIRDTAQQELIKFLEDRKLTNFLFESSSLLTHPISNNDLLVPGNVIFADGEFIDRFTFYVLYETSLLIFVSPNPVAFEEAHDSKVMKNLLIFHGGEKKWLFIPAPAQDANEDCIFRYRCLRALLGDKFIRNKHLDLQIARHIMQHDWLVKLIGQGLAIHQTQIGSGIDVRSLRYPLVVPHFGADGHSITFQVLQREEESENLIETRVISVYRREYPWPLSLILNDRIILQDESRQSLVEQTYNVFANTLSYLRRNLHDEDLLRAADRVNRFSLFHNSQQESQSNQADDEAVDRPNVS